MIAIRTGSVGLNILNASIIYNNLKYFNDGLPHFEANFLYFCNP